MMTSIKLRVGYTAGVQESYILARNIPQEEASKQLDQLKRAFNAVILGDSPEESNPFYGIIGVARNAVIRINIMAPKETIYINLNNMTSIHLCIIGASDV